MSDLDNNPSYDNALGEYEDSGRNALVLQRQARREQCPACAFVAADEVELRVHTAFEHPKSTPARSHKR